MGLRERMVRSVVRGRYIERTICLEGMEWMLVYLEKVTARS